MNHGDGADCAVDIDAVDVGELVAVVFD